MEPARTFVAPRELRVATLPVGYADGCGRLLSNRAQVLIGRQGAGEITADSVLARVLRHRMEPLR